MARALATSIAVSVSLFRRHCIASNKISSFGVEVGPRSISSGICSCWWRSWRWWRWSWNRGRCDRCLRPHPRRHSPTTHVPIRNILLSCLLEHGLDASKLSSSASSCTFRCRSWTSWCGKSICSKSAWARLRSFRARWWKSCRHRRKRRSTADTVLLSCRWRHNRRLDYFESVRMDRNVSRGSSWCWWRWRYNCRPNLFQAVRMYRH